MNRRPAISLIELLLTMSACSVILTMSATLIHRVLHAQSKTHAILDSERNALRLSEQFRRDVHGASAAETEPANLGPVILLRLRLPDGSAIEYHRANAAVLRVQRDGSAVQAREQFSFPTIFTAAVDQDARGIVTLSIVAPPAQKSPRPDQPAAEFASIPLSQQAVARLNQAAGRPVPAKEAAP